MVVGCWVGEEAVLGSAATLARTAATCATGTAPPLLPHEFIANVSASAISWSDSCVMAGITELYLTPFTTTSPSRPRTTTPTARSLSPSRKSEPANGGKAPGRPLPSAWWQARHTVW